MGEKHILVTTFYSPKLFWFVYEEDIPHQKQFCNMLNDLKYNRLQNYQNGQLVIVKYGNMWVRAELIKTFNDTPRKEFLCWLYDYGIFCMVQDDFYQLPEDLQYCVSYVKKAMIYGMIPAIHTGTMSKERAPHWAPDIRKKVNKLISNSGRLQKFSHHCQHNGYEIGDLFYVDVNGEEHNFAEHFIDWGLGDYDEELFKMDLFTKQSEAALDTMYDVYISITKTEINYNESTQIQHDRETTARSPGENHGSQKVLPDDLFADAEPNVDVSSSDMSMETCSSNTTEKNNTKCKTTYLNTLLDTLGSFGIKLAHQHIDVADKPKQNTIKENEHPEAITQQCIDDQLNHEIATKDADDIFQDKSDDISRKHNILDNEGQVFHFPSSKVKTGLKYNFEKLFPISKGHGVNRNVESASTWDTSHRYKGRGLSTFDRDHRLCNRPRVGTDQEYEEATKVTDPVIIWFQPKPPNTAFNVPSTVKHDEIVPIPCFPAGAKLSRPKEFNEKDIGKDPKQFLCAQDDERAPECRETSLLKIIERNLGTYLDTSNPTSISETWYSSAKDNSKKQLNVYSLQDAMKDQQNADNTQEEDTIPSSNYEQPEALQKIYDAHVDNGTEEYLNLEDQQLSDTHSNISTVSSNNSSVQGEAAIITGQKNLSVKSFSKIYIRRGKENVQPCDSTFANNDRLCEPPEPLRKPEITKSNYNCNLFKSHENYGKLESKYQIHSTGDFINKLPTPRLLVHGLHAPLPSTNFNALAFDEKVQQQLVKLNCCAPNDLQTYTWPAIMRGQNVIAIHDPKTGKTMSYLPAICSFVNLCPQELRDESSPFGPRAIIFCPTSEKADYIYKLVNVMLNKRRRAVLLVPPFYDEETTRFKMGADILICSPRMFIRVFMSGLIHLKRVAHIVLENANDILEIFSHDMELTFNLLQITYSAISEPMQLIVISEEYTTGIELLAQQLLRVPLICIGSYFEAGFYGHVEVCVKFTGSTSKYYQVIELIERQCSRFKTVIISNDLKESNNLVKYLNTFGYHYLALNENSKQNDITSVKRSWAQSIVGRYPVLVCTNNILQHSLRIDDASFVIQLNMPTSYDELMYLYSSFTNNYHSPFFTTKDEKNLRLRAFIFLDETNLNLVPRLLFNLIKKGATLTPNVYDRFLAITYGIELEKINRDVNMCKNIMHFGICKKRISCLYRHTLSLEVDLPKSVYNYVKIDLVSVRDVTSFYARLIEYKDHSGEIHKASDRSAEIAEQLEKLANSDTKTIAFDVRIGSVAAVEETENLFRRCKIVQLKKQGILNQAVEVLVHVIDTGAEMVVSANKLYMISEELKRIPPQVTEVYIAGMGPPDLDENWSQMCFNQVKYKMSTCHSRFTGKVVLQFGNAIFVNNLRQKNVCRNMASIPFVKDFLLGEQLADDNPMNLQRLYELCDEHEIPVPYNRIPYTNSGRKTLTWEKLKSLVNYSTPCNGDTPDYFYIKLT